MDVSGRHKGLLEGLCEIKRLYHVTLWERERQSLLQPRVPIKQMPTENDRTKRISMAPTIEECLFGLANSDFWKYDNRIRVYLCEVEEDDIYLDDWWKIYREDNVFDAPLSHEHWYLRDIHPLEYMEYYVENVKCEKRMYIGFHEKMRIAQYFEEEGFIIPEEIKQRTTTEILNYYMNHEVMEKIKCKLTHYELDEDDKSEEIRRALGMDKPEPKPIREYGESDYIVDCDLVRISHFGFNPNLFEYFVIDD